MDLKLTLMKKPSIVLEVFVGLLTLFATIITLYPFKFFGIGFGGEILAFGIMISAVMVACRGSS